MYFLGVKDKASLEKALLLDPETSNKCINLVIPSHNLPEIQHPNKYFDIILMHDLDLNNDL